MKIGDSITAKARLTVYSAAGSAHTQGHQEAGAAGRIVAGPRVIGPTTWWRVDFAKAPDGWVRQTAITGVSADAAVSLFSGLVRPPWLVAGEDFMPGPVAGTAFADWRGLSLPGVRVNVAGHEVRVSGAAPAALDGVDFSLGGGAQVFVANTGPTRISNFKFVTAGPSTSAASVAIVGEGCGDVTLIHGTIDGRANGSVLAGLIGFHNGVDATLTAENVHVRMGTVDDVFNIGAGGAATSIVVRGCLVETGTHTAEQHGDILQTLGWGSRYPSIVVEDSTFLCKADPGGTQGLMCTSNNAPCPVYSSISIARNTFLAPPGANLGQAVAVAASMLNGTADIRDNYIDTRGIAFGWWSEGDGGGPYRGTVTKSGNIDMVTGGALT